MKINRRLTYKKVTRSLYLLGLVFLLSGLFLSMINVPAQAGAGDPNVYSPTRLPPGGAPNPIKPPSGGPAAPKLPPSTNPGGQSAPSLPSGLSGINRNGGLKAPSIPARRIDPLANSQYLRFTQTDYCYDAPQGPVSATVTLVSLPAGVTSASVQMEWYMVNPTEGGGAIVHHYFDPVTMTVGETQTVTGTWPGTSAWPTANGNPVEIHFGANIINPSTANAGAGLDLFYAGGCSTRPAPTLNHTCNTATNDITWTIGNPGTTDLDVTYIVDGGTPSYALITPGGSSTFTTPSGLHTVVLKYDNQLGTEITSETYQSEASCGVAQLPLRLDKACAAGGVQWTLTNPNLATAVSYTWVLDEGTPAQQTGSGTLNPNGSIVLVTASDTAAAHNISVTFGGTTLTGSSVPDECTPTVITLVILRSCIEGTDQIQWQVRNDGNAASNFTWTFDAGTPAAQTGSGFANPGDTVNVLASSGGVHTLAVTWSTGTASSTSNEGECVTVPPVLSISYACSTADAGVLNWTITNESTTATVENIGWVLDDNAKSGTVTSLAPGASTAVTTSPGGQHTLAITWGSQTASRTSEPEVCGGNNPIPLSITPTCGEGGVEWLVSNSNPIDIPFSWTSTLGGSGSATAPAGGGVSLPVTPLATGVTINLTWTIGGAPASSSGTVSAEFCGNPPPVVPVLKLSYACYNFSHITWSVKNTSTVDAPFTWDLDNGKQSGEGSVAAGKSVSFLASGTGKHTVKITWLDGERSAGVTTRPGTCIERQVTPPPPVVTPFVVVTITPSGPTATPGGPTVTPMPTVLMPAAAVSGNQVALPVTGADLSRLQLFGLAFWQKLLTYLGALCLGAAFMTEGLKRKK